MGGNDYLIAGHRLRVEGEKLQEMVVSLSGFRIYAVLSEGEALCTFREGDFPTDVSPKDIDHLPMIKKMLLSSENELAKSFFCKKKDGGYLLLTFSNIEDAMLSVETDEKGKDAYFTGNYSEYLLKYACWVAYSIAAVSHLTVPVHASTILYEGKAVLFLGESGTGKSTHTRLWRENIEGATLLNDDSPVLRIEDGKVMAYGSPWSGKLHCYVREGCPLAACVRLSQAPYNRIKPLNIHSAFTAIHPSCPPPFAYDERLYDDIVEFISRLLSDVPVYHMEALPDKAAALLTCTTIFGSCKEK